MEAIAQYGSSDEEQDDDHLHPSSPSLHLNPSTSDPPINATTQGRIRSFPHVPGNFAVHVFINIPTPEHCRPPLENLLQQIKRTFPTFSPIEDSLLANGTPLLLAQTSYHVSLSRTLPIRLPLAEPLLTSLRNNLHQIKRFALQIHPVLEVFLNDDKTRTFLALKMSAKPVLAVQLLLSSKRMATTAVAAAEEESLTYNDPLLQAINAVSDAFEIEELQRFYDPPRPHISLGWLPGDQSVAVCDFLHRHNSASREGKESDNTKVAVALKELAELKWEIEPEVIWCKIGHVKHSIWKNLKK